MPSTAELAQDILDHSPRTYAFSFSPFLSTTYSHKLLNPSDAAHQNGHGVQQGQNHNHNAPNSSFNSLVCKHWLRGLCKKGTTCEFLHEYNLRKMPECNFFVRNGYCSNGDECLYLHIDPSSKLPPCPHYERGFCPLGPNCAKKHVRRKICSFYLAGFCPDGRACSEGAHPRWRTDLGDPVAKTHVQSQREVFGAATGMATDGARHHYGGGYHRDDADGDGQDMDAGSHRDRGFGRDHGRDRDRPRDGDHGGQRRWRGGRGGRGGRGNRRFKDRH